MFPISFISNRKSTYFYRRPRRDEIARERRKTELRGDVRPGIEGRRRHLPLTRGVS